MKTLRSFLLLYVLLTLFAGAVHAQTDAPLVIVMNVDGAIMPAMGQYIQRGLQVAEQRGAELVVIRMNTPGGSVDVMNDIIADIGASSVPVVVYISPARAWAASAGTLITLAGHAAAMAPETVIGAASPVDSSGQDLNQTMQRKSKEILKAKARTLAARRGPEVVALAESTIEEAKAITADEALKVGFIDFIATDLNDLLHQLDGFTVQMPDGPRSLHTAGAVTQDVDMSFIEQLLLMLTDPNIAFLLIAIGVQAILIEIGSPGGWVAGFIGVVCLALATYGMGVLPVNWFGIIFIVTAFVLFILDIKAPTHGALTVAGVGSFIVGALVLFNSPGTPQFQRVSVPLVIFVGVAFGAMFAVILAIALKARHAPLRMGAESLVHKRGVVRIWSGGSGQVQLGSELWSAEVADDSESIGKGDTVEVVQVEGLRLKVRKKAGLA